MVLISSVLTVLLLAGREGTEPAGAIIAARDEAARLLRTAVAGEPDIDAVQSAAEARAAPSREDGESWRTRARLAGMLPKVVAEYRHDDRMLRVAGVSSGQEVDYLRTNPGDSITVRLGWSLDGFVFGRLELAAAAAAEQAAAKRASAAERATKLYFERLRLRLALTASPPPAPRARAEVELELASITAQLHALTGLYREELR